MSELESFLAALGVAYVPSGQRINVNDRRFVASPEVASWIKGRSRLVYAGKLLGRARGAFQPSAVLLRELSDLPGVHRTWVDERVGWLFVCGRDIFIESILRTDGEMAEGSLFLVILGDGCLGYGRVESRDGKLLLANLFDIGDFLRRERRPEGRADR